MGWILLLAGVLIGSVRPAAAQAHPPRAVTGVLVDATSGTPIRRGYVCVRPVNRCATADSLGHFRIAPLPIGRVVVTASCSKNQFFGADLDSAVVELRSGDTNVTFRADGSHCDQRPFRTWRGDFVGYFTHGFEVSSFGACDPAIPPASVEIRNMKGWHWPQHESEVAYSTVFVHWRGTLIGPGGYGHLNGAEYEMVVDTVYELRLPRATDCKRPRDGAP